MVRLIIIYRAGEGAHFDFGYYLDTHLPMSRPLLAEFGLLDIQTQRFDTRLDGSESDIVCMTQIDFPDEASLRSALQKHGPVLRADFANYTNIQPDTYLSKVLGQAHE